MRGLSVLGSLLVHGLFGLALVAHPNVRDEPSSSAPQTVTIYEAPVVGNAIGNSNGNASANGSAPPSVRSKHRRIMKRALCDSVRSPSSPSSPSSFGVALSDGGPGSASALGASTEGTGPITTVSATGAAPMPKPKNVGEHFLDAEVLFSPSPHLPDVIKIQRRGTGDARFTAKLCIDTAGAVTDLAILSGITGADEAIASTVRTWRYRPQPIPLCFIAHWLFRLE